MKAQYDNGFRTITPSTDEKVHVHVRSSFEF